MQLRTGLIMGVFAAAAAATLAIAGGHGGDPSVKARKAHMQLYAHNLGILGGMAKGEVDFDAERAQLAADNLAVLVSMPQSTYWTPGTSNAELGAETRSLPGLWDAANWDDVMAKSQAMGEAAAALKAGAGSLDGIRANIGAVGEACGACHKAYRAPAS